MPTPANSLNITQPGLVVFDGVSVFTGVTLTPGTGITITNGSGIGGNPVIGLSGGLAAVETLSSDNGTLVSPSASNNIQLVGHVNEQGSTKFSTISSGINLLNINPMSVARWIVDPLGFNGTHTTLTTATASATSGDTIAIMPGTYTENFTAKPGVNYTAIGNDSLTPNVTIVGKITMTGAGTCTFTGIRLQTNSDNLISITGSNACVIKLKQCYLNCTNNTGISIANTSASVSVFECEGDLGTTGIALFTSTGSMLFQNCYITNTGNSTTASLTNGAGNSTIFQFCYLYIPLSTSTNSAFVSLQSCIFALASLNVTALTTAGTGGSNVNQCYIQTGTASAISVGSGTTLELDRTMIFSTNTNAVTGAGTLNYSLIDFLGASASNKINTTTATVGVASAFQNIVRQVFTSTGTYTPTSGMKYCDIEVVGGGGGGGGTQSAAGGFIAAGGGGGGGGYARGRFTAATIGTSQSVTIGAAGLASTAGNNPGGTGGTTSVGSLISATGGVGGSGSIDNAFFAFGPGGAGGAGSNGDFQTTGTPGHPGISCLSPGNSQAVASGNGGSSFFGGGANGVINAAGNTANSYGGGGSGAGSENSGALSGGAGFKGVVIVTEYV